MELRQLTYFVAVVEEGNFTRAAERLGIAQPGVSAQVGKLERELGQVLLHRWSRRVEPTEAGRAVLPYARAALEAVAGAQLAVDQITGLVRGRVRMGMVPACAAEQLAELLADFHRRHPGVEIVLSEGIAERLLDDLRSGELDLAWVALAGEPPAGVATHALVEEPYLAVVEPGHPLAGHESLTVAALRGVPLICLPHGSGMRSCVERASAAAGFVPQVAFEASAMPIVVELAARGLGVGILPTSIATAAGERLRRLRFREPELRGRVELAWRSQGPATPAGRALVAAAQEMPRLD